MGYEISYEGRIEIDPPLDAGFWRRLLQPHPSFGAIDSGVPKILDPDVLPILSEDGRTVVAVEPGPYGAKSAAMVGALRCLAHVAALAGEEAYFCRFPGHFYGTGEERERYRVEIDLTDIVRHDETGEE